MLIFCSFAASLSCPCRGVEHTGDFLFLFLSSGPLDETNFTSVQTSLTSLSLLLILSLSVADLQGQSAPHNGCQGRLKRQGWSLWRLGAHCHLPLYPLLLPRRERPPSPLFRRPMPRSPFPHSRGKRGRSGHPVNDNQPYYDILRILHVLLLRKPDSLPGHCNLHSDSHA